MAGLQSISNPVTATAISTTAFGLPVVNNLTVLANPPLAKMRNSTTQSIPNTTTTALTWDTEDFDTVGGHNTSSNTSRYTCQIGYAGYYLVRATASWAGNSTGVRDLWFQVNGSPINGSETVSIPGATSPFTNSAETILFLNATDYVEAVVSQNSGGALSTSGGGTGALQSRFEVQWIHQ